MISAPAATLPVAKITHTENAKLHGDIWVYKPLPCHTGALHAQPQAPEQVSIEKCCDFTPDYSSFFDGRGALDAPIAIPSGGVRALDFPDATGRLLISHVYRDGVLP